MWDLWESTGNGPLVSPPVTKCRYAVSHAVRCLGRAPPTPLERPGREEPRADGVFASGASQQTSIIIIAGKVNYRLRHHDLGFFSRAFTWDS